MRRDGNYLTPAHAQQLMELIRLAEETGVAEQEWFKAFLEDPRHRRLSPRTVNMLMRTIRHHVQWESMLHPEFRLPASPSERQAVDGPYRLGTVIHTDQDFGLRKEHLQLHFVIGGASGYGKSTLVKVLTQQIIEEDRIKVWLIDPKEGGDFRFLARDHDVLVLRPEDIQCNPFGHIPNVSDRMLKEISVEVTGDAYGVFDASEAVIAEHVYRLFEEHDQPCFPGFAASVGKEKVKFGGRRQGYLDTIQSRSGKAMLSLGDIVNCRQDYFSELYGRHAVFEVGSLSGSAQRVLVPWIIMKLVLYKIANRSNQLSHLLVFDEAQAQLFSKAAQESRQKTSYMATLATQVRAYGLGIMVLAQNPGTKLLSEIVSNSSKMCFHLSSGVEVDVMGRHMGLSHEQMARFHSLDRQEAICRVGLGYTEPVLFRTADFHDMPMSNEELQHIMAPRIAELMAQVVPYEPEPTSSSTPPKEKPEPRPTPEPEPPKELPLLAVAEAKQGYKTTEKTRNQSLSDNEETYLRVLKSHPYRLITEMYALLGNEEILGTDRMSQTIAVNCRKRLTHLGLIESVSIKGTGKSGRSQCDVLMVDHAYKPRGGHLHAFWCYRVAEYFRREGGKTEMGCTVSGFEVDVHVVMGIKYCVEIVITTVDMERVLALVGSGEYDRALVLVTDKTGIKKYSKAVTEELRDKVEVKLLKDYFVSY